MIKLKKRYTFFLFLSGCVWACVKPFEPEVITGPNSFLVVDGIINTGRNAETVIVLSRTRRLSDTVTFVPELRARVRIEGENSGFYELVEKEAGRYVSAPLNLASSIRYRLSIATTDGNNFISDYVIAKQTPPIDSLSWRQDGDDITLSLSTHDPQNDSRYYRWEYNETWEYNAFYDSHLKFVNGQVEFRDSAEQTFRCWKYNPSTDIILHSNTQLNQDIVRQEPLVKMNAKSTKLQLRYSILARQFTLTKEAF